jgi:hypothetical protein
MRLQHQHRGAVNQDIKISLYALERWIRLGMLRPRQYVEPVNVDPSAWLTAGSKMDERPKLVSGKSIPTDSLWVRAAGSCQTVSDPAGLFRRRPL